MKLRLLGNETRGKTIKHVMRLPLLNGDLGSPFWVTDLRKVDEIGDDKILVSTDDHTETQISR